LQKRAEGLHRRVVTRGGDSSHRPGEVVRLQDSPEGPTLLQRPSRESAGRARRDEKVFPLHRWVVTDQSMSALSEFAVVTRRRRGSSPEGRCAW
jgi:hypothetical protein